MARARPTVDTEESVTDHGLRGDDDEGPALDGPRSDATGGKSTKLANAANRYALVGVWATVIVVFGVLRPETFLTTANFETIFGSQSSLVVLTLGLIVALAAAEFDLSVAGTLGLAGVLVAILNVNAGWDIGWAIAAALGAAVIVGAVNALLVVRIGVDAIVATLGMGTLLLGLSLWLSDSATVGGVSEALSTGLNTTVAGLPLSFYYAVGLTIVVWYVFSHTPLGRHLLFVGQGREVAKLAGINVNRIRAGALIASGALSGLAGIILAGTLGAFQANVAPPLLLPAFAAAFLGSTVVDPGRFNPWGSFIAIYFLVTGITGLQHLGLSGWIQDVFYGASLIIAVSASTVVRRRILA